MKNFFLRVMWIFVGCMLAVVGVDARQLSPDEALARVMNGKRVPAKGAAQMRLAYTMQAQDADAATVYVFSQGEDDGSFLVLAADDAVGNLVLGYSEAGAFNPNSIPCNMQWVLDAYSAYVEKAVKEPQRGVRLSKAKASRQAVAPLVQTTWNQSAPYNNLCPNVGGRQCVTGCVATAMAQVMKYHEWPEQGTGSHSYEFQRGDNTYTASADFGETTYDWANMKNSYWNSYSGVEAEAVATLMYHCGVASDMDYSPDGSGASGMVAGTGMLKYFDYDKSMKALFRMWFTADEWDEIVYSQLAQGLPVLYTGSTASDSGHAFVCDGWDRPGYFHINWGWGGFYDGYFRLDALDPEGQGIGGSDSGEGFNYWQMILCDIMPDEGSEVAGIIALDEGFEPNKGAYSRNGSTKVQFNCIWRSYALGDADYDVGVKLVSDTQTKYLFSRSAQLSSLYGYMNISINAKSFPEGQWDVYPAYKTADGEWHEMYYDKSQYEVGVHAVVTSDEISFGDDIVETTFSAELTGYMSANGWSDEEIYTGHTYDFYYRLTGGGTWNGYVAFIIIDENYSIVSMSDLRLIRFTEAGTKDEAFTVTIDDIEEGAYYIALTKLVDGWLEFCSDIYVVDITTLMGDTNNDGEIDITDYVNVIDYINYGDREGVVFNKPAADVNGDGEIDITDAVRIIEYINAGKH